MKYSRRYLLKLRRWIGPVVIGAHIFSPPIVVLSAQSAMVDSLAAGGGHTCALLSNGTVRCWGDNEDGLLGDGVSSRAWEQMVHVTGITTAKGIAAGLSFSCAVLKNGTVKCWGENDRGQLGNGTTEDSPIPLLVEAVTGATKVVAGSFHACALLHDGTVRCWGDNDNGQ